MYRLIVDNFIVMTPSVTTPTGGVSMIIYLYSFFNLLIRSSIFLLLRSSDGLGGIGPEGIISRLSIDDDWINCFNEH